LSDRRLDLVMRFGVFIPMLLVGLGLTYTRFFGRIWEWVSAGIATATLLSWVFYVSRVSTLPPEFGYVGVILITAFTYTLLHLRFVLVMLVTAIGIGAYLPYAFTTPYIVNVSLVLAVLYLLSFGFLGALASYRLERFTRDLFLRERQLEVERTRSDGLLLNMLPAAIVEQLKTKTSIGLTRPMIYHPEIQHGIAEISIALESMGPHVNTVARDWTRGAVGPLRAGPGCVRHRVKAAIRKAAVLPVPVWDWPATSLPRRASGSAASWIAVVVTKPASSMPRRTGPGRSSEEKESGLTSRPPRPPATWPSSARPRGSR